MNSGIYKIFNKISEKFYIGSAVNIKDRWRQHCYKLKNIKHRNAFLQAAWNLHGQEAFELIILEYCEKDKLLEREQYWLDLTQCYDKNIGYNLNKIAGSMLGYKHSEETKLKFKDRIYTDEIKLNMRIGQKGKKYSQETKDKLSKIRKGRIVSEETRERMRQAWLKRRNFPENIIVIGNSNGLT